MSIRLEQVTKRYGGAAVVSDVSADIADGEFFVLLGPSGSGKSTLLRAIAGLTTIDHGRIVLRGRDVTNLRAREREVGFVFQNYALFRHMSVADNIEFALRARRVRAADRRRRRQELLRLVALEGFDDRLPGELSGGQQQRVAVARALAHEPRVLLLDEPFGALDAKIRDELRRAIRGIQRAVGITTILVTHDQEEAFTMADRIGVMDRARLQDVGEPHTLYARPGTRFVATFLGAANLVLGQQRHRGVRLGESIFPIERPVSLREGEEVTIVVRPEDIAITRDGQPGLSTLGRATVTELQFVGPMERVRLSGATTETLTSALRPAADALQWEALRTARESEALPLRIGQQVVIGARRVHALPTPISSLRLVGEPDDLDRLAATRLVRELAERMRIEPTRHDPEEAQRRASLQGLPVIALDDAAAAAAAIKVLERGARQVLAIGRWDRQVERMLIYLETPLSTRDVTLAAAASLARQLEIDVVLLVSPEAGSSQRASYREVLDMRNAALRTHGLDVRTETFRSGAVGAIRKRLQSSAPTLLVIGLPSTVTGSELINRFSELFAKNSPAAVLFVRGRPEAQLHAVSNVLA